ELLVLHSKRPVGITRRKAAVRCHLVQVVAVEDLENRLVEVQPVGAGLGLNLVLQLPQVRRQGGVVRCAHSLSVRRGRQSIRLQLPGRTASYLPLPRNSLIEPRMASRSGMRLTTTLSRSPSISWTYS